MPLFILAAARTPFGAFGGSLRSLDTGALGAHALRGTLARSAAAPDQIAEVILGCALPAGSGGNPARLAALGAGIPNAVPAFSPCAGSLSGLKAIALAAQKIQACPTSMVLAGGAESCSRAPYLAPGARWGVRIGEGDLLDSLLVDGAPVAAEAERLLQCHGLCAADLEAWIESSRRKASAARAVRGSEFAPLAVIRRGSPHEVTDDEGPETARVPLPRHLAAPADGAAALLLSDTIPSGTAPLARILDWVETGSGWTEAIRRLLHKLRLPLESIDRWEIHEPSAAHALALLKDFPALDPARVNARGGALAIGDPLGASGARLLLSLAQELEAHRLQTGIAVIPGATGMALAMAISRS